MFSTLESFNHDHHVTSFYIDTLTNALTESKGGNVRGITEDHRYEMLEAREALRVHAGVIVT